MQIRRQAFLQSNTPHIRLTDGVPRCGSVVETEIARCMDMPRAFAFQLEHMGVVFEYRGAVGNAGDGDGDGAQALMQGGFIGAVQGARGLVEDDDARRPGQHACERQALLFANRQLFFPVMRQSEFLPQAPGPVTDFYRRPRACLVLLRYPTAATSKS